MEFDDFNASNYPPAESVLQAEAVFTQSGPHDAEEEYPSNKMEGQIFSIELDGEQKKKDANPDRSLFIALHTILLLAIAGLVFSVIRYVQVRRKVTPILSTENGTTREIINDSNIASVTAKDPDPDRDYISYRSNIEHILSSEIHEYSSTSFLEGARKKAIDWLVYEDRVLTTTNIQEMGNDLAPTFPLVQRYAMMVLFFGTNGELWSERSWAEFTNLNECKFMGIECDLEGHAVVLDLAFRKLRGRLPEEVGLLTNLESASFMSNNLEGTIPSFIYNKLTNLHFLDLSSNDFSSIISSDISKLTNLRIIRLNNLSLTGQIPFDAMKALSTLEQISITQATNMNGPILEFSNSWPNLTSFDIYQSQFTGTIPPTISVNTKLEHLWLQGTQMDLSNIPTEIGLLTKLLELSLVSSRTTRIDFTTLPTELGNCQSLYFLHISGQHYSGPIPTEIGRLTDLDEMLLHGGMITGFVPSEIGQLSKLDILDLSQNQLKGTLPKELGALKELKKFELYSNELTGSIPSGICSSPDIRIERDCSITQCECCSLPCRNMN